MVRKNVLKTEKMPGMKVLLVVALEELLVQVCEENSAIDAEI